MQISIGSFLKNGTPVVTMTLDAMENHYLSDCQTSVQQAQFED